MAIGVTVSVSGPIEAYDSMHAAMLRYPMPPDVGLVSHATRQTADGFEVIEVWDSKEVFERFVQEILPEIQREVMGDAAPELEMRTEFWEVRGLVVPGAGLFV